MNRRGMTFIELMIVITILGIVANIAIPKVQDARRRATAANVIGDFVVVRAAAFDRYAAVGSYPSSSNWGEVPPEFVTSLPVGFTFDQADVSYRWRRWSTGKGGPSGSGQSVLLGLQIKSQDRKLMESIKGLYGGPLAFGGATQVTLVID